MLVIHIPQILKQMRKMKVTTTKCMRQNTYIETFFKTTICWGNIFSHSIARSLGISVLTRFVLFYRRGPQRIRTPPYCWSWSWRWPGRVWCRSWPGCPSDQAESQHHSHSTSTGQNSQKDSENMPTFLNLWYLMFVLINAMLNF